MAEYKKLTSSDFESVDLEDLEELHDGLNESKEIIGENEITNEELEEEISSGNKVLSSIITVLIVLIVIALGIGFFWFALNFLSIGLM